VSSEIQTLLNNNIVKYINTAIKHPKTSDDHAIKQFITSYLKKDSHELVKTTLKNILDNLNCISTKADVCKILGEYSFKTICNIINIYDGPEEQQAKHLRLHLAPPRMGLPAEDYYLKHTQHEKRIFSAYKDLLNLMGKYLNIDNLHLFADKEQKYAHIIEEGRDEENITMKGSEIEKKYNEFDWNSFWNAYGFKNTSWKDHVFIVDSSTWLKYVNNMFKSFDINYWRNLLQGMVCMCFCDYLGQPIKKQLFYVYEYLLNGQKKQVSNAKQLIFHIKRCLPVSLSRLYVQNTHSVTFRNEVKQFIQTIQEAAVERINETEWLDIKTRNAAAKKVRNINLGVLYMTSSYNYTVPKLGDNLLENILKIGTSLTEKSIRDVSNKYTTDKWDVPVYNVNAYYLAAGNRLVIPSAIVNHPFYCSHASAGSNYGALGAVIGHEITHAFDDYGKDFDEYGNRTEWWSTSDKRRYTLIVDKLIKLYNNTKLYGRHIDGENTLGENIADLGGLAISLHALKKYMEKEAYDCVKRKENLRDFFCAFATSWREEERKEYGMRELIVDVHSPAISRVNNIVPHFQEWYDAFSISENDKMYIIPDKRIRIF
jgi:putative endopeptidase